jgi:putative SOS response-associated peptidase YedK
VLGIAAAIISRPSNLRIIGPSPVFSSGNVPYDAWMCNRFRMTAKQQELALRYGIRSPYPEDATIPPPELFPKRPAWIVRSEEGRRILEVMNWGFPHTVMGASGKPMQKHVTNVRNYTSPFWRTAMANPERRCLVPFTAFSEYGPGPVGAKPVHWFDVPSQPITSFAGVFRHTENGPAMAFLTCEPNPLIAPVHPKAMPVLLAEEDEERWLACGFDDAIRMAQPFPSQLMRLD